jgi:ABC-type Zn uptake system ZnuABC Zn-binding protein ZnuA
VIEGTVEADPGTRAVPGQRGRLRAGSSAQEYREASRAFRRRNIATFHNVFDYLARDYGLTIVGEVETAPGQEPSAGEIRKLVRKMRDAGVPALFTEPQYPARIADAISREAGIPTLVLDPVVTGSTAPGYYEAMRRNLRTLREALSR